MSCKYSLQYLCNSKNYVSAFNALSLQVRYPATTASKALGMAVNISRWGIFCTLWAIPPAYFRKKGCRVIVCAVEMLRINKAVDWESMG